MQRNRIIFSHTIWWNCAWHYIITYIHICIYNHIYVYMCCMLYNILYTRIATWWNHITNKLFDGVTHDTTSSCTTQYTFAYSAMESHDIMTYYIMKSPITWYILMYHTSRTRILRDKNHRIFSHAIRCSRVTSWHTMWWNRPWHHTRMYSTVHTNILRDGITWHTDILCDGIAHDITHACTAHYTLAYCVMESHDILTYYVMKSPMKLHSCTAQYTLACCVMENHRTYSQPMWCNHIIAYYILSDGNITRTLTRV